MCVLCVPVLYPSVDSDVCAVRIHLLTVMCVLCIPVLYPSVDSHKVVTGTLSASDWGKRLLELDVHTSRRRHSQCKVCVTDMLIVMVFGNLKWNGYFGFITVILHCVTPCSNYLWQNFIIAVSLVFVVIRGGTTICVLNVYSVTSRGTWRARFTFPTFYFIFIAQCVEHLIWTP